MTPTAILFKSKSTTTHTTMTTASHNVQSVPVRSDDSHGFDIYQSTMLGACDVSIRSLVLVLISVPHIINPPPLSSYSVTTSSSTSYFFVIYFHHYFLFYLICFRYLSKDYRLRTINSRLILLSSI